MLTLNVPGTRLFNEETNELIVTEATELELEHSLVSLSKWESLWEKPFLSPDEKTMEQTLSYVMMMCKTPNVPSEIFFSLANKQVEEINNYISAKMTATWFAELPGRPKSREVITAEIVYHWMIALNIPFECQYWHLNRLFALIKVCNEKNAPKKKMSPREVAQKQRQLNEERRSKYKTRG